MLNATLGPILHRMWDQMEEYVLLSPGVECPFVSLPQWLASLLRWEDVIGHRRDVVGGRRQ